MNNAVNKIGKWNYIFNRGWSWLSKAITIWNALLITYLAFQKKDTVLLIIPIVLIGLAVFVYLDLKFILPNELTYGRKVDPEYVRFSSTIEKKIDNLEKLIKEK